ncbi:four helix bundle protein [Pedobacter sp. MW01-1-1]|uniref:four helix bundle protein n=1 Tax=Pedobacter sp. MW01-1-1 TaxID=3383027 RepID=UPI003FEEA323
MLKLNHKNLEVYKASLLLVKEIYVLTKKLPTDEKYNLVSQLKRASISICSNIAEGAARKSSLERKRFYEMSRSSLVEIDTQIEALILLNYINREDLSSIEPLMLAIFKMISGLIAKTL